jgi:hypothetical protein
MITDNSPGNLPATLVRQYVGRLLDISSVGCLIEIAAPLSTGFVGRLEAVIDGHVHVEAVRVARIVWVPDSGGLSQVGLEFLLVSPIGPESIRTVIARLAAGADASIRFVH